jgi:hypothetical protein
VARDDDGHRTTGNAAESVAVALSILHWSEFDPPRPSPCGGPCRRRTSCGGSATPCSGRRNQGGIRVYNGPL